MYFNEYFKLLIKLFSLKKSVSKVKYNVWNIWKFNISFKLLHSTNCIGYHKTYKAFMKIVIQYTIKLSNSDVLMILHT